MNKDMNYINYRYQRVMMKIPEYKMNDWYNFGRFGSESEVLDAFTFCEDQSIQDWILIGAIRENRYPILEMELEGYINRTCFNPTMALYSINKEMVDYLNKYNKRSINLYRYHYLVGKCRILPLKKLKKQIDGLIKMKMKEGSLSSIFSSECLVECLKASAENKDEGMFYYIYQKYHLEGIDVISKRWEIMSEALEEGNKQLVSKLLPYLTKKDFKRLSLDEQQELQDMISKTSERNILLFEKIQDKVIPKIPADVTRYIINKFIFPEF